MSKIMMNNTEKHNNLTVNKINTNNSIEISKGPIISIYNNISTNQNSIANFNNTSINSNFMI